jgi:hypothetical protein
VLQTVIIPFASRGTAETTPESSADRLDDHSLDDLALDDHALDDRCPPQLG